MTSEKANHNRRKCDDCVSHERIEDILKEMEGNQEKINVRQNELDKKQIFIKGTHIVLIALCLGIASGMGGFVFWVEAKVNIAKNACNESSVIASKASIENAKKTEKLIEDKIITYHSGDAKLKDDITTIKINLRRLCERQGVKYLESNNH